MAKAKTTAGTNLPVPQNDAQAEQLIARLGALQRDHEVAKAEHGTLVAALEERFGTATKVFQETRGVIVDALNVWASANRERLTQGGKSKTVHLPTGDVLWQEGKFSVSHRGLKIEDVIRAVGDRIEAVQAALAVAKRERRRDDAARLEAEEIILWRFLREKVELDKNAMLAARDLAETIPGVTIQRGPEEFVVKPLASQISEVA